MNSPEEGLARGAPQHTHSLEKLEKLRPHAHTPAGIRGLSLPAGPVLLDDGHGCAQKGGSRGTPDQRVALPPADTRGSENTALESSHAESAS